MKSITRDKTFWLFMCTARFVLDIVINILHGKEKYFKTIFLWNKWCTFTIQINLKDQPHCKGFSVKAFSFHMQSCKIMLYNDKSYELTFKLFCRLWFFQGRFAFNTQDTRSRFLQKSQYALCIIIYESKLYLYLLFYELQNRIGWTIRKLRTNLLVEQ